VTAPPTIDVSAGGPERVWTVLDLLQWTAGHFTARGIETARLDAECLLAFALGVERLALYVDFDKPVSPAERSGFRELVRRRAEERVPVAQLVGHKEFWSLPLTVSPGVLVPRPETEKLVEVALDLLPQGDGPQRILDLGTGSGAVALALASERPNARVTASDVSPVALETAAANARALGLEERVRWLAGRWFEPVAGERFDLVVSNPPYVAESRRDELQPELAHEPPEALFSGADGLDDLRELVAGVGDVLEAGGAFAFEISPEQEARVAGWCREAGLLEVRVSRDLANRARVVSGRAPLPGAEVAGGEV
jgi:release factor glutamine methyltransferase